MEKKEKLIINILKKDLIGIQKTLKNQETQLKDIRKNGISSEVHPAYHIEIQTGLSYTSGYCTGHIKLAESVINLLGMSSTEIEELIADNKRISAENKKYLDGIFNDIKKRAKEKPKKLNDNKKTRKA